MNYGYSKSAGYSRPDRIPLNLGGPNIHMSAPKEFNLEEYQERLKRLGLDGGLLEKLGEKRQDIATKAASTVAKVGKSM